MKRFSFRPALELRGRTFKGLRGFSGKPAHPPLTDVTVGAYTIGPVLDLAAFVFRDSGWSGAAHVAGSMVLLLGAISSVATAATGFADWLTTEKGTQMRRMVNAHAWTMIALTAVVLAGLWYRYLAAGGAHYGQPDAGGALLSLVILGLVTLGGTIGGSITYDFGFNVETASDNHVYHRSEHDIVHPHDEPPAS